MKPAHRRTVLKGSRREPLAGAKVKGKLDLNERLEVSVRVRAR